MLGELIDLSPLRRERLSEDRDGARRASSCLKLVEAAHPNDLTTLTVGQRDNTEVQLWLKDTTERSVTSTIIE